ncbi:MAG: hypothetical protein NT070_18530 [Cyanobacteria bacterium]|nr:hypothetical protein [Cyanobacteriota bacterium]
MIVPEDLEFLLTVRYSRAVTPGKALVRVADEGGRKYQVPCEHLLALVSVSRYPLLAKE